MSIFIISFPYYTANMYDYDFYSNTTLFIGDNNFGFYYFIFLFFDK